MVRKVIARFERLKHVVKRLQCHQPNVCVCVWVCVCVCGCGAEPMHVHFSLLYLSMIMYQLQFYQISGALSF